MEQVVSPYRNSVCRSSRVRKTICRDARVLSVKRLYRDGGLSINHICKTLGISRPTFYRYLALGDVVSAEGSV